MATSHLFTEIVKIWPCLKFVFLKSQPHWCTVRLCTVSVTFFLRVAHEWHSEWISLTMLLRAAAWVRCLSVVLLQQFSYRTFFKNWIHSPKYIFIFSSKVVSFLYILSDKNLTNSTSWVVINICTFISVCIPPTQLNLF